MNEINQIVSDIKNGVVKPIYFLIGWGIILYW